MNRRIIVYKAVSAYKNYVDCTQDHKLNPYVSKLYWEEYDAIIFTLRALKEYRLCRVIYNLIDKGIYREREIERYCIENNIPE